MSAKINLTQVQPAPGYLFIEPEDQPSKTSGGIYLPDNAKGDKPQTGKILAVGGEEVTDKGKKTSPVKKGDTVLYKKWGGNEVKIDNKEYLFVNFEDVLACLSN